MRAEQISSNNISRSLIRYVLFISPDTANRRSYSHLLSSVDTHNYVVLQGKNIIEAKNIIDEEVVDAILIDTEHLADSCIELLQTFKRNSSLTYVPRIVLLDDTNETDENEYFHYGAIDCVQKPTITPSCLHRSISVGIEKMLLKARVSRTTAQLSDMAMRTKSFNSELIKAVKQTSKQIKTPLAATREMLDMLIDQMNEEVSAESKRMLAASIQSVDKISKSLDELVSVAQSNQKQDYPLTRKKLHTNELLQDAVSCISHHANEKEIKIIQQCGSCIPDLWGDRFYLHQVFTTILLNAVKHMNMNGTLKINIQKDTPLNPYLLISINDTGKGIHPNFLDHIFTELTPPDEMIGMENFDRLDIGLHSCEEIVDSHGGEIIVESAVGVGSKFTIRLPVYDATKVAEVA